MKKERKPVSYRDLSFRTIREKRYSHLFLLLGWLLAALIVLSKVPAKFILKSVRGILFILFVIGLFFYTNRLLKRQSASDVRIG